VAYPVDEPLNKIAL